MFRTARLPAAAALLLVPAGIAAAQGRSARSFVPAHPITAGEIDGHLRFLSSDLLEGRAPATRGGELAALYIASQLRTYGMEPGGPNGSYFQRVPIDVVTADSGSLRVTVSQPGSTNGQGATTLRFPRDVVVWAGSAAQSSSARAELVFVGYGASAPEYQWDDFKGVDVRGKVLLVLNNDPEDDPALFAGRTRLWYGRWPYKYEEAARRGAAGCLIVHTDHSAAYPWSVVQSSWSGEQMKLPEGEGPPEPVLEAWATEEASRKLAALAGQDLDRLRAAAERRDFRPGSLGVRLSLAIRSTIEK